MRVVCLAALMCSLSAQAGTPDQVRSALLFQIAKFIDFTHVQSDSVRYCFTDLSKGPGAFLAQQQNLLIRGQPIAITELSKSSQNDELSRQCDITYFDGKIENDILSPWIKTRPLTTFTVGSNFEFLEQGGVAALIQEGKKIRLYINREQLEQVSFKVQARLMTVSKFYPN
ncbi:YfiR family protein [Pseudoalteromonas ruthenica]|uniref:DUF4154 domain-containing protein n=1 Tax=Pseudoalteromonas ruthenica TaxID=151081 RepID=A0A0F4PNR0_9GAMM|nr:YfiR family protein [Pseudoalteromonas ruthenica]KJY97145.1 hypothetical protein TW72_15065 [Pseudoalteromonas ruthenica]KJY99457.1 hypothetical protein TW76_03415 [Pseudoalteromonas ruthenica]